MLFKRKENLTKNKQKQTTEKHPTPIKSTSNLNLINNKFIVCLLYMSHFSKCFANNVIISALGGNRLHITSAFILFMRKLGLKEVK